MNIVLIYILEKLSEEYEAIVFEDMDRLDHTKCISIFHQLREINLSLNERGLVNRFPFRFLYVVNDELMEKINQTKFFDYIMSVVPSLGHENAIAKFQYFVLNDLKIELKEKEKDCIFNAIDASILLKDYRTLKQIKNDYMLFSSIAKSTGIIIEKCQGILLGFIIYKVLWPQDYNLIRCKKSFVFPWKDVDDDMWKKRNNDQTKDPHKEYNAIQALKDILTNKVCLKFIGYSIDECIYFYKETLKNSTIDKKEDLLSCDDDFICGRILFDFTDNIQNYVKYVEDDFLLYLIRYYSQYSQKYSFDVFIEKMVVAEGHVISSDFVSKVENALKFEKNRVDLYIFTVRYFLKREYHISNSSDNNAFGWLYDTDRAILKQRINKLAPLINDEECDYIFSKFSKDQLLSIMKSAENTSIYSKVSDIYAHNI